MREALLNMNYWRTLIQNKLINCLLVKYQILTVKSGSSLEQLIVVTLLIDFATPDQTLNRWLMDIESLKMTETHLSRM